LRVAALARACKLDVERAVRALGQAKRPRLHTFIATSDIHLRFKLKKSQQQVLDQAVEAVELARSRVDDVEFSAEDATRTDPGFLERVCRAVVDAGATTVNLPDTVGYSTPDEFADLIRRMVCVLGDSAVVSVHCHNDLGLAMANSIAALQAGARQIECTVNGIGERAGNCSLEEAVMAIRTRQDRLPFTTGIVTEQLYPASRLLSEMISFGPQPNKAIVGRNAFAHEAGIHQDGFLKERTTYEIIEPHTVGVPSSRLVLGKHSGRHALQDRCEHLGYPLAGEELDLIYRFFIAFADRKKGVLDEEIVDLIRGNISRYSKAVSE
jgi:2-isopropylmalate synthase